MDMTVGKLSGGEQSRILIARLMLTQANLLVLDEPTVGLHYDDVKNLIEVLQKLVDRGNTVVVIEHNLDLIKCADYLLDFGPEGGDKGGKLVAKGTPEDVANNTKSHTGYYLKKVLKKK
jgi:excinuclease ABC subunit A